MSGCYNGCKSHILRKNRYATHSGCSSHTLNLSGESAACCCIEAITFFGIVQKLYNLFSSSPQRWEILLLHTNSALSTLSKTRWSARADAVKVFKEKLPKIVEALEDLLDKLNLSPEMIAEINGLIKHCQSFDCLILAHIWHNILKEINIVNEITQKKGQTLEKVAKNLNALIEKLTKIRNNKWMEFLDECKQIAAENNWSTNFLISEKRSRKRKRFFDETGSTNTEMENENPESKFKEKVFQFILDNIIDDIKARFTDLQSLNEKFSVLWNFNTLNERDIFTQASTLYKMFDKDLETNLDEEICQLKSIYAANFEDTSPPEPFSLLKNLKKLDMTDLFPNINIALRIFLTIPASVASIVQNDHFRP